jgi:hypothetical protein
VSNYPSDWDEIVVWSVVGLKGNNMVSYVRKLCLGAAVYHLWLQRNAILHGKTPRTKEQIISRIRWEVRARVMAKFPVRMVHCRWSASLVFSLFSAGLVVFVVLCLFCW